MKTNNPMAFQDHACSMKGLLENTAENQRANYETLMMTVLSYLIPCHKQDANN
ncbi:hypothetical protein [Azomonas macrocytogenes]|uniref:Uncharacterized protein n=1 Tax=Azomonas macrocytogenes TaxID=69962 RepID=A0A839T2M0_AZOMA|nr:hypothetical protein [Azomonas macrocytogenes]MBB3102215.1 hypothetical protein [Azomonas macrocytogenes]